MNFPDLESMQNLPIGVFDSGVGGLTVLKELQATLPEENFIYLGDTARLPYGPKGRETIIRYSLECAGFLESQKIKLLVVACNTASSLALESLSQKVRCPVIGTIEQAVKVALRSTESGRIGVIGTDATIASGVYRDSILKLNPRTTVISKACPLFVPLVEQGMFDGEIVEKVIELYLSSFKEEGVDVLVLGCTHYPLLAGAISNYLGEQVSLVECSKAIAEQVKELLLVNNSNHKDFNLKNKVDRFYVTDGVARFDSLAALFLKNGPVRAIKLDSLSN